MLAALQVAVSGWTPYPGICEHSCPSPHLWSAQMRALRFWASRGLLREATLVVQTSHGCNICGLQLVDMIHQQFRADKPRHRP